MTILFDSERWDWGSAEHAATEHLGRPCVRLDGFASPVTLAGLDLLDGTFEVELAVGPERSFHGIVWRVHDPERYESFFVRPHQVGNPDAIQYTPVFNGQSSWQLYHGDGFWNAITFPIDEWFRLRVAFAGSRADVYVDDELVLECALRLPPGPGRIGLLPGGDALHVAGFTFDDAAPALRALAQQAVAPGAVPSWSISEPFAEEALAERLPGEERSWTPLVAEPSGLVDLTRAHPLRDDRNTVLARATVRSESRQVKRLDFGFSDRAVVYLNGRALYRGDDGYRSRDYRFLGSIGWYDAVYLPLEAGENELVVAVSEDFGGWGVQARFPDPAGVTFEP